MPDEGPKQTIKRDLSDEPDVGPYYPSGMSAPEAAQAGALIPEQQEGEEPEEEPEE